MKLEIPAVHAIFERQGANHVVQIAEEAWSAEARVQPFVRGRAIGYEMAFDGKPTIVLITNGAAVPEGVDRALRLVGLTLSEGQSNGDYLRKAKWVAHPSMESSARGTVDPCATVDRVQQSWTNSFSYRENVDPELFDGLRAPQIGAIHAIHAHWSVDGGPGIIVMPTGSGKTETMLGAMVSKQCERVLVVVPTDALRTQLSNKFLTLGLLKRLGVIKPSALYPVVGVLRTKPKTKEETKAFVERCNVVVTTMAIAGQCTGEVQRELAALCPYLFIDEAHHIQAPTWQTFKRQFSTSRVLLFTATPYRNDRKSLEGAIIYRYPLRKAQKEGYFTPIRFEPVVEFDPALKDQTIADAAVKQLREDLARGHRHVLMARVSDVERASVVLKVYERYPEFNPVQIHTGIKSQAERDRIKNDVIRGHSRIVICVDMLGEGFDLPELKIAAFHDVRKSLPVTIQLAGRFTRGRQDLGDATIIVNIGEIEVKDELRLLYQQDSDWNVVLPLLSERAVQQEVDLARFFAGFQGFADDLPLQNVRPAMSAVAYRTTCANWTPEAFERGIPGFGSLERSYSHINTEERTLVVVTAERASLDWAQVDDVFTWDWQLYILFWDKEHGLLFIHNSSNNGFFKGLAEAVAGEVRIIQGGQVFRCLSGVGRLQVKNVGLLEQLGRLIRFTMHAGADVVPGITRADRERAVKSNIFGNGYEAGGRMSIGCSYKGRLWSMRHGNMRELVQWCSRVGAKLIDENIDPEEVLRGTLQPTQVGARPNVVPVAVDWPEIVQAQPETRFAIEIDGSIRYLYQIDVVVKDFFADGPLVAVLRSEGIEVELELILRQQGDAVSFSITSSRQGIVRFGTRRIPIAQFFEENPPTFWFVDGSSLTGNELVALRSQLEPFPKDSIEVWDWSQTDIKKESQGVAKATDTIQYAVIEELKRHNYDVIYDDDDHGEAADVVAIRDGVDAISVEFYHCKFSAKSFAGARIEDLYAVCGQAQTSVRWMERPTELFNHLLRRQTRNWDGGHYDRIEVGTQAALLRLREKSRLVRVELKIFIVQPGVAKEKVSRTQLELLAVTENYLMETFLVPLGVVFGSSASVA